MVKGGQRGKGLYDGVKGKTFHVESIDKVHEVRLSFVYYGLIRLGDDYRTIKYYLEDNTNIEIDLGGLERFGQNSRKAAPHPWLSLGEYMYW